MSLIKAIANKPTKYIGMFQYHVSPVKPHVEITPMIKDKIKKNIKEKLLLIYDGWSQVSTHRFTLLCNLKEMKLHNKAIKHIKIFICIIFIEFIILY